MDFYKGNIPILEPGKSEHQDIFHPKGVKYGLVPRDYNKYPEKMFAPPSEMATIIQSEWDARYDEQEATQSSLEHLFLRKAGQPAFINLDQNGDGHCWAYSTGHSIMFSRLRDNLPLVRLNPHGVATCLNQMNGGWCGLSGQFAYEVGYPVEGTGPGEWPLHSNNSRYDTPACRASMALHKVTENYMDMTRQAYDRELTTAQVATAGFLNLPSPQDFNWWGHSVCGIRWVRIEAGSWGPLIINSWLGWGRFGLGVLRGSQAICNNGIVTRSTTPSVN